MIRMVRRPGGAATIAIFAHRIPDMKHASFCAAIRCAAAAALLAASAGAAVAQSPAQAPASGPAASAPANPLRPEVAAAVYAAQEAGRAGQKDAAEAKLREAAAVPALTPFEQMVIERGRASVALSVRDHAQAIKSLDAVAASNQLTGADQLQIVELLAKLNYQEKDFAQAAVWARRYIQDGGNDPALRDLLAQALYLGNDFKGAASELEPRVAADEAAGRATPETSLRLLISSYMQSKDDAGYQRTLERIALAYPKPEYWAELLSRAAKEPGFSERLWLDVYRLRLAAGVTRSAEEYVELAQLALRAGYPAEALRVIDRGLSLSLLGHGAGADEHAKLRERAEKAAEKDAADRTRGEGQARAARDGEALVNLGFAWATAGQAAKGAALMEQGVAKGTLRRPDETQLHLGIALWMAGRKDDALKALAAVGGTDGSAALARVWSLFVRSPAGKA
jgi:hypothetical protein